MNLDDLMFPYRIAGVNVIAGRTLAIVVPYDVMMKIEMHFGPFGYYRDGVPDWKQKAFNEIVEGLLYVEHGIKELSGKKTTSEIMEPIDIGPKSEKKADANTNTNNKSDSKTG